MQFKRFEDIIVWQKAKVFTLKIYGTFKLNKDFNFRDQIQRASISIMNNIAEGFERKGNKEFIKFLFIAKGSCAEVRSMLHLAFLLKYINLSDYKTLLFNSEEISKMLSGLIKSL